MMGILRTAPVIFVFLLAFSCERWLEGDFFFLRHEGADIPIWVKGNVASGTFILFLHGGPGGTAIGDSDAPGLAQLEKKYAVVYFDQRSSGSSQGNSDEHKINLAQFVEDTTLIIDLIRQKYRPMSLFLMGHSWGGALAVATALNGDNQTKLKGWIDVSGVHDYWKRYAVSRDIVLEYAENQIIMGVDVDYWTDQRQWLMAHPSLETSSDRIGDSAKMQQYIERIRKNPVCYDQNSACWESTESIWTSPISPMSARCNFALVSDHNQFRVDIHLSDEMGRLTLPSLILFGRHDFLCPPALGQDALDSLGTPEVDKRLVIFEHSGHYAMREEGSLFASTVSAFVEVYR